MYMTLTNKAYLVGGSGINFPLLSVTVLATANCLIKFGMISCARDFPCILQGFFFLFSCRSSYILV